MVEKKKTAPKVSRFMHEDEPETEVTEEPQTHPMMPQALYSVGPGAPLASRRAAAATTERDRRALKKKTQA